MTCVFTANAVVLGCFYLSMLKGMLLVLFIQPLAMLILVYLPRILSFFQWLGCSKDKHPIYSRKCLYITRFFTTSMMFLANIAVVVVFIIVRAASTSTISVYNS